MYLSLECTEYLNELDVISDPSSFTKVQFNKLINKKIHSKNKSELLIRIQSYKKLVYSDFVEEEYGLKPYLKNMRVEDRRTYFAYRSQMLRTVQHNYKQKPEFKANNYKCVCGEDDIQSHLIHCSSYAHLRDGLNLEGSDEDLVKYFQLVIREREAGEDEEG